MEGKDMTKPKTKIKFREYLEDSEELEKFIELENKLSGGLGRGAMLSAAQCHLVLMEFAWAQGNEQALEDFLTRRGKPRNSEKLPSLLDKRSEIDKTRCLFRHNATGARCILEQGHEGRHHYRCAGVSCPGYPWPASEMPHPPSCVRENGSPYDASRDQLSACSCGSPNVEISFPFNLPADAGLDPTVSYGTYDFQHAHCLNCGRKGPEKQSISDAIQAWNRIMMNEASIPSQKDREEKGKV
jgi:hypothetical protein